MGIVAIFGTTLEAAMPAVEQNALIAKYCPVCHTGAARTGKAPQMAWLDTTKEQALGAKEWFVRQDDEMLAATTALNWCPKIQRFLACTSTT